MCYHLYITPRPLTFNFRTKRMEGGGGGSADAKKQLADFSTHSHFTRHFRRIITEIQSFNTVLPKGDARKRER